MHCNLVKFPQDLYKRGEDMDAKVMKLAKAYGVKFIELRHAKKVSKDTGGIPVRGFQGVTLQYTAGTQRGVVGYQPVYDADVQGNPMKTTQGLKFIPEKITGILEAWCPDTEYNRNFLASLHFSPGSPVVVYDKKVAGQIEKIAIEKGYNKPKMNKTSELVESQSKRIAELEAQIAFEKEKARERYEVDQQIKELKTNEEELHEKARAQIHEEEKEWLEKKLAAHRKKGQEDHTFYVTKVYRDTITPKVKIRFEDLKQNKGK